MKIPRTIYAIQHNKTKRIYIGSSANVPTIKDMQKDFDDFGEDFSLFILDEINSYADRIKEYEWMKKYQSHIRG